MGTPLVVHALRGVLACPDVTDVVVVGPPERMPELAEAIGLPGPAAVARQGAARVRVVRGGAERTDSVAAGLAALPHECGIVLVHDAARALTPVSVFDTVITAVRHGHPAVVPGLPLPDTVKQVRPGGSVETVVATPDRSALRAVQTPQGFLRETLERAHQEATGGATDDAALVEAHGGHVRVVPGHPGARKITTPEDLAWAEALLAARPAPVSAAASLSLIHI